MKRTVPVAITFLVGSFLILARFIPPMKPITDDFNVFFDLLAAFAFFLGGANLIRLHGKKVVAMRQGWIYSAVCLGGFLAMLFAGLSKVTLPATMSADPALQGKQWFTLGYDYFFRPVSSTIYALLAFYIASASYRAFRAKNTDATILLVTAMIILLGRTFVGALLTSWLPDSLGFLDISTLANWIMSVPNQAGNRAIMFGVALGTVSLSMKVILGIDRSHLGEKD